uniref:Reticuline oxidase-like protein n=1 Tax=Aegilops tauschii TaxID=37682 RepID=R7VZA8_AEGTA
MANSRAFALVPLLPCALSCHAAVSYAAAPVPAKKDAFFGCLVKEIPARLLYAKSSPAFPTVLAQTIRNSRWSSPQNVQPLYIITPTNASHIQSAVVCGRRHAVRLRRPRLRGPIVPVRAPRGVRRRRPQQDAGRVGRRQGSHGVGGLRGGGGESFGIVVSWQVNLLPVPPTVTVFQIPKTVREGAVELVNKWQLVGPALPDDLMIRIIAFGDTAKFEGMYLGTCKTLTPLMTSKFPELGMNASHCNEMPWIKSVPFIHLGKQATLFDLLNRNNTFKPFAEYKSDYVYQPVPKTVWAQIFVWLVKPGAGIMIMDPYGAAISATPEAATPFPHRKGVLFNIQYVNYWFDEAGGAAPLQWSKDMYRFMEPYVSKNPRQAYANYRDIDLGRNEVVNDVSTYASGKVWGEKYFKGNFQRLAITKGKVDPQDYFRNEQSIPPLLAK